MLFCFFNDTATAEIYTSLHSFPYTTLFRSLAASLRGGRGGGGRGCGPRAGRVVERQIGDDAAARILDHRLVRFGQDVLHRFIIHASPRHLRREFVLFVDLVEDRKSVVSGMSVSVWLDLGGRRVFKKKK